MKIKLAYYCSGHGYGHATRVSAFASALLSLDDKPEIHIVSSAPMRVFLECVNLGAQYRHVEIDPIISQPLAYTVDRRRSLDALQAFLAKKDTKLADEVEWLNSHEIDCVLSDAAFLACEAATKALLPSILITNFTFDSVYSYLGTDISNNSSELFDDGIFQIPSYAITHPEDRDTPLSVAAIEPLVSQVLSGYQNADMLLLLPGFIPIPSFFCHPPLPAGEWIDPSSNRFRSNVEGLLQQYPLLDIYPSLPFSIAGSNLSRDMRQDKPSREVKIAPLFVRALSPNITRFSERNALLKAIGVPKDIRNHVDTRILVVSFGGQTIGRPRSKIDSRTKPPCAGPLNDMKNTQPHTSDDKFLEHGSGDSYGSNQTQKVGQRLGSAPYIKIVNICIPEATVPEYNISSPSNAASSTVSAIKNSLSEEYFANDDKNIPSNATFNVFSKLVDDYDQAFLPSPSWIAIVCGVSANWTVSETDENLPSCFYIAPQNIYMPDLTAIADVVLGKLGYGTVSECIAYATPLVYVPRPLFIEEHGLRRLIEAEGVGVELSQQDFEYGRWAKKVEEAFRKGKGNHYEIRSDLQQNIRALAGWVVQWVRKWQGQGN